MPVTQLGGYGFPMEALAMRYGREADARRNAGEMASMFLADRGGNNKRETDASLMIALMQMLTSQQGLSEQGRQFSDRLAQEREQWSNQFKLLQTQNEASLKSMEETIKNSEFTRRLAERSDVKQDISTDLARKIGRAENSIGYEAQKTVNAAQKTAVQASEKVEPMVQSVLQSLREIDPGKMDTSDTDRFPILVSNATTRISKLLREAHDADPVSYRAVAEKAVPILDSLEMKVRSVDPDYARAASSDPLGLERMNEWVHKLFTGKDPYKERTRAYRDPMLEMINRTRSVAMSRSDPNAMTNVEEQAADEAMRQKQSLAGAEDLMRAFVREKQGDPNYTLSNLPFEAGRIFDQANVPAVGPLHTTVERPAASSQPAVNSQPAPAVRAANPFAPFPPGPLLAPGAGYYTGSAGNWNPEWSMQNARP